MMTCGAPGYDSKELSWDATMRRPSPVGHSTRRLRIWTRSGRSSAWPQNVSSFPTSSASVLWTVALSWRKRSEEHTSELQSRLHLVYRLLLENGKAHV